MDENLENNNEKIGILKQEIDFNHETIHLAQKAYQLISTYANSDDDDNLNEENFQSIITQICSHLFKREDFTLELKKNNPNGLDDENIDFKWIFPLNESPMLNLCKNSDKTHQYRLNFSSLSQEDIKELGDVVTVLKLLINMTSWIHSLKYLNNVLMAEEVLPLRQDCKTLTIINNVRSILEEANSYEDYENNFSQRIDSFAENIREFQDYLQEICERVFSAISLETE